PRPQLRHNLSRFQYTTPTKIYTLSLHDALPILDVSGKTEINGLIQDAQFIEADLSFEEMAIAETNTDDFTENWTQAADVVKIEDGKIVTDYLFQSTVSLEGAKISIDRIDEPELIE